MNIELLYISHGVKYYTSYRLSTTEKKNSFRNQNQTKSSRL